MAASRDRGGSGSVVDTGASSSRQPSRIPGSRVRRHGEVAEHAGDRLEHRVRLLLPSAAGNAAIEQEVMVLVGGDTSHDLVGRGIVGEFARVAVARPRGEFLSRGMTNSAARSDRRVCGPSTSSCS